VHTTNHIAPETRNPWNLDHSPGGSSGGAAASVAAGLSPIAIGTDGGGSIRQPAAFCGVVGLHPSRGRVPLHGSFRASPRKTSIGPIARDVRDAALLLQVMAGVDARDPFSMRSDPAHYVSGLDRGVEGLRIAWSPRFGRSDGADSRIVTMVGHATSHLADAGAHVQEAHFELAVDLDVVLHISGGDGYAAIGRHYEDPDDRAMLAPYAREVLRHWATISAVDYSRALDARARATRQIDAAFDACDAIVTPTVGIVAPPLATYSVPRSGDRPALPNLTGYTNLVNFTGHCAASVPCGFVDGLPVGMQIIAPPDREALVLRIARTLEVAAPWSATHPPLST
jgi:Asp-tRNA(Asn)/Glu-tRNA(Gln) amidotransferase A subunit family amidase